LIHDLHISPEISQHTETSTAIYCGVDPTAKSLHLGNLVTLMGLLHFQIRGHQTIALVGGATGSIGDPSGRSSERIPLSEDILRVNVAGIEEQIHRFFSNGNKYANRRGFSGTGVTPKVLNNYEWFSSMNALEFLGNVGRYARVNTMLAKESVKSRIETTQGISFTEFSYQLLQAYDFWYLHKYHGCRIQIGGSDQWGNITAGIDMINRKKDQGESEEIEKAYGITIPLLLTSSGDKFGKSAGNAVWLNESMTSIFDFYQFFMKTADADVGKYLSMFTLLNQQEIDDIIKSHQANPEKRIAQEKLAMETTELVHGREGVQKAKTASQVLFGGDLSTLTGREILDAFKDDSSRLAKFERSKIESCGLDVLATLANATQSKSEAQKKIKAGGMYINNVRVIDPRYKVTEADWIDNEVCVLRVGKSSYHLIQAV
ncbi:hypothetical protein PHYBLDRAFT_109741, partial [Phycomyces blakesleeanus NRRL 1555(-)]